MRSPEEPASPRPPQGSQVPEGPLVPVRMHSRGSLPHCQNAGYPGPPVRLCRSRELFKDGDHVLGFWPKACLPGGSEECAFVAEKVSSPSSDLLVSQRSPAACVHGEDCSMNGAR